jgi:hypothetical protein
VRDWPASPNKERMMGRPVQRRYKIVITEYCSETKTVGKDWVRLSDDKTDDDQYGYSPEIEKTVEVEREVFKQGVTGLDITDVIKAVNGL